MSKLTGGVRATLVVALTAALSTVFSGAAHADPSPSASSGSPPAAAASVTADYHNLGYDVIQAGDPVLLYESGLTPPDATVTRRINWGDGSPIQLETRKSPEQGWIHKYPKVGTYHFSVELVSGTGTSAGRFPDGDDTVKVIASAPPELLSATYHLVPDHVRANEPVTLKESDFHGEDSAPVYTFRYITWGDGTPEEEYSGYITPKPHKYAKPGTYHVSVRMTNQQWHTTGTFPDGNTVIVTGASSSAAGGTAASGGGTGGGLPVTGPGTAAIGGAGLALVLGGAVTFALLRRRRLRFVR